jgi:hypothetical protein
MARSSTSFRPKWKLGNTTVVRVPQTLAPAVLRYAHELDDKTSPDENQEGTQAIGHAPSKHAKLNKLLLGKAFPNGSKLKPRI